MRSKKLETKMPFIQMTFCVFMLLVIELKREKKHPVPRPPLLEMLSNLS